MEFRKNKICHEKIAVVFKAILFFIFEAFVEVVVKASQEST